MIRAIVIVLAACGSRGSEPQAELDPPKPVVVDPARAPKKTGAEQAWERYRDAHAGAVTANAVETGKRLWPLLAPDAQKLVDTAGAATLAAAGPTTAKLSPIELRYKILGETAAVRAAFMKVATISEQKQLPDAERDGSRILTMRLTARDGATTLMYELVRADDGPWLIAASPALLATDQDVFKTPAGRESHEGAASIEDLVAKWKQINASGTGWDAYNLMSPEMRKNVLRLVARVGGSGAEDAARIWEKTLVDRRTRGISITDAKIEDATADRAAVQLSYSLGGSDRLTLVRVDGKWWIEMPL